MLQVESISPMGNEEDWINYLKYLDNLNDMDETVISEKARASKILEMIKKEKAL
jgi:hypothetical protein